MTEWLKVHGWNPCVGQLTGGSNPPLSATFIVQSEGRAPETGAREPRQVREEATVAMFLGLWVARLSPCTINRIYYRYDALLALHYHVYTVGLWHKTAHHPIRS